MPLEERKYKDINQFGEGDQAKVCVDIMHKTGAHLELSLAKDQGLSIMVSGKLDAVMKARKEIVSRLQTQVRRLPDGGATTVVSTVVQQSGKMLQLVSYAPFALKFCRSSNVFLTLTLTEVSGGLLSTGLLDVVALQSC